MAQQNSQINLQFNELVSSFYDKTNSIREYLSFESCILIFTASDFSIQQEVHHNNFEPVDNTRDSHSNVDDKSLV